MMKMGNTKAYLGDAVYAEFDGYQIKLTTDHGAGPDNVIWLDPDVFGSLVNYAKGVWKKPDAEQKRLEELENANG